MRVLISLDLTALWGNWAHSQPAIVSRSDGLIPHSDRDSLFP